MENVLFFYTIQHKLNDGTMQAFAVAHKKKYKYTFYIGPSKTFPHCTFDRHTKCQRYEYAKNQMDTNYYHY